MMYALGSGVAASLALNSRGGAVDGPTRQGLVATPTGTKVHNHCSRHSNNQNQGQAQHGALLHRQCGWGCQTPRGCVRRHA